MNWFKKRLNKYDSVIERAVEIQLEWANKGVVYYPSLGQAMKMARQEIRDGRTRSSD